MVIMNDVYVDIGFHGYLWHNKALQIWPSYINIFDFFGLRAQFLQRPWMETKERRDDR